MQTAMSLPSPLEPDLSESATHRRWFDLTAEVARLEAIVVIQQEVATSAASLPALMSLITKRAQELTGAAGAIIKMPEGEELVYRAATGSAEAFAGLRVYMKASLAGLALQSGQALKCDDAQTDERVNRAECDRIGARSMVVVPLIASQTPFGALEVVSPKVGAFDDQSVQTLRLVAGIIAARLALSAELLAKQILLAEKSIALGALRDSESRFRSAFDDSAIGMALVSPDGRWLKVNTALSKILGYERRELLAETFQSITHAEDLPADLAMLERMLAGEIHTCEIEKRFLHKDGSVLWTLWNGSLVADQAGRPQYLVVQIQDIAARKQAEELLRTLAIRDDLTGLYNRRELDRLLSEEISRATRNKRPVSLVMIDVDRFKDVNDSFGHPAGDAVLQQMAKLLVDSVRPFDRVARYGGEELAIILPETSASEAMVVAERVRTRIEAHKFSISRETGEATIPITASAGLSTHDAGQPMTPIQMIRSADRALYAAKHGGRNRSVAS
jgi:diguanylate cyclase (GGDEF)-like protein/PAS domain S-box-containing protein